MSKSADIRIIPPEARVLLIDDDPNFRSAVTEHLSGLGLAVTSVSSLEEAERLLSRREHHLVISDIHFEGNHDRRTGDEFLLDNDQLFNGTQQIVVTGSQISRRAELEERGVKILKKGDREFLEGLKQVVLEAYQPQNSTEHQTRPREEDMVALGLYGNTIKLVSLTPDGECYFIDKDQNLHNILYVAPSETLALQLAIEELESLVNDPKSKEIDFQDFFERNPDFILNDEYKKAHAQIVLTRNDGSTLVPDFILEPIERSALCDLLELKLPSAQVFVLKESRMRFSAAVLETCAQLREYALFFDEERNRRIVAERHGLTAYKPRMFVIIGRRGSVSPIQRRKIEGDTPGLQLRTYDEIMNRMKTRFDAMKKGRLRS